MSSLTSEKSSDCHVVISSALGWLGGWDSKEVVDLDQNLRTFARMK